jgi:hypothetical protein
MRAASAACSIMPCGRALNVPVTCYLWDTMCTMLLLLLCSIFWFYRCPAATLRTAGMSLHALPLPVTLLVPPLLCLTSCAGSLHRV